MEYMVQDLLEIPFFKNAAVLTGKRGVHRKLNWYEELYADRPEEDPVLSSGENDILILADDLKLWTEERLNSVLLEAVRCGAGCLVGFFGEDGYRIPAEGMKMMEAAGIPFIILKERRLPIGILSREIAMNLLQHSRNSRYLEEMFLYQTGEKKLSRSDLQLIKQCSGYDFDSAHQTVCIGFEEMSGIRHGIKTGDTFRIRECCENWFSGRIDQMIAGISGQTFVIFLPAELEDGSTEERISALLEHLKQRIHGVKFKAGIGSPQTGLDHWRVSLKEARLVIRAMNIFNWGDVRTIGSAQPAALLLDIRDQGQLFRLRNPVIRPLYSTGTQDAVDGELAHTLEMYFRYGRNSRLTAEKMFLHRNTLSLRLRKIEKLCGVDLSDPVRCRELEFAIYVEKCLLFG